MENLYLGIMTGTSLDGINLAIAAFTATGYEVKATQVLPLPSDLSQALRLLIREKHADLYTLGQLDQACSKAYAHAVNVFLERVQMPASQIRAIGMHGQTIWHAPQALHPFTWQLGDPNQLAYLTHIPVVADVRRKDMAAGGQGAPLAPLWHRYAFHNHMPTAVVNIGGIANLTILTPEKTLGYDTGPGNTLLDAWILEHLHQPYDHEGAWASRGQILPDVLRSFLEDPYFAKPAPKSTGREYFNLAWIEPYLHQYRRTWPQDIQTTLTELTAVTLAENLSRHLPPHRPIWITGGGAHNLYLLSRLQALLPDYSVASSEAIGIDPDFVEALLMAYLAYCHVNHQPGNIPDVTGAREAVILGGYYPA